ncbi:MAG: OprD family outer membrane porin [Sulfurimonas sp.]|nr:OprD family outer membrane porin [Sulfurimonas sp.]
MKKNIALSAIVVGLLGSVSVQADDALSTMFKDGKTSGQIREFTLMRDKDKSGGTDNTERSNAIGGHLKFETAEAVGFSLGARLDTTNGFANPDTNNVGPGDDVLHKPNLDQNGEGYSILGEAYVQYKNGETSVKIGRQTIDSPLMAGDDYRMIRNFHNSVEFANTSLTDIKFTLGHTSQMAPGSFANTYNGGILGATTGYSAVKGSRTNDFINTGLYSVGEATDGVTTASITYTGVEGLKVRLWDYYAHDISNTIYGDIAYKAKMGSVTPFVAGQFISQSSVGDKLLKNTTISKDGELEGFYYGLKAGLSVSGFTAYVAYSATTENDSDAVANGNTAKNAIILQNGGYPAYTQGMVTRHMTLAGAKAVKVAGAYSFKEMGPDVKLALYYISVDLDKNNGYTYGDTDEKGFDIIYNTQWAKGLQLRLRGNYSNDFNVAANGDTVGWSEYRFIANYTF